MSSKLKPLSATPPQIRSQDKMSEFINQANKPEASGSISIHLTPAKEEIKKFPWEDPHVREDLKKLFNLRLTEKDFIKLDYLSKCKKESMHKVCLDILIPEIEKQLESYS